MVSAELVLKQAHDQAAAQAGANSGEGLAAETGAEMGSERASLVDLSSLVNAINSLWTNTGRLLYPSSSSAAPTNAAPSQASADGSTATPLDMHPSSTAVSARLETLIDQLSTLWSNATILPLRVYVDRPSSDETGTKFTSTYEAFETCIESIIPEKAAKVVLWIEDLEVQRLIVSGVTEKVIAMYERFYQAKPEGKDAQLVEDVRERVRGEWRKGLEL